jgi:hypothetical protein
MEVVRLRRARVCGVIGALTWAAACAACGFDSSGLGTAGSTLGTTSGGGSDGSSSSPATSASTEVTSTDSTGAATTGTTTSETGGPSGACPDGWWNSQWRARVPVDLDHTGDALPRFVVPLGLGDTDLRDAATDGADVRVVDAEGTLLSFESEAWSAGSPVVWVSIPELVVGTQRVYVYFGNPEAAPAEDPQDVWNDYEAVWHLAETSDGLLRNSADAPIHGTVQGLAEVTGIVGRALRFEGDMPSRIDFDEASEDLFDGWSAMSLSMWIYPDYDSGAWANGRFLTRGGPVRNGRVFPSGQPDIGHYQIDFEFDPSGPMYRRFDLPRQTWSWVVYDFDGERLRLYLDGELYDDQPTNGSTLISTEDSLHFGADDQALSGILDEVLITDRSRSASWYAAQHRAMTGDMVTVRPVERCDD